MTNILVFFNMFLLQRSSLFLAFIWISDHNAMCLNLLAYMP